MVVIRSTRNCNHNSRCRRQFEIAANSILNNNRFISSGTNSTLSLNASRPSWSSTVVSNQSNHENSTPKRYLHTDLPFHLKLQQQQQQSINNEKLLKLSYPFSTGHIQVPGMSSSFQRTAQSIIHRACFSTNSHFYSGYNNLNMMCGLRTLSSAALSPKKDDREKKEIKTGSIDSTSDVSSSSKLSSSSNKSTTTTKKSPFVTSAVVDTDDSLATKIMDKTQSFLFSASKTIASLLLKMPGVMFFYLTHPREFKSKLLELAEAAKKEAHHYWMGSKLLAADIRTARHIMGRTLEGNALSRRERKQLLRTITDIFRVVPMSIFVLVPFLEFALPFALKIFPNMLPSTFQDSLKAEENMKRELTTRLAMAEFFQETLQNLAKDQRRRAEKKTAKSSDGESTAESVNIERQETAASFLEFIEKARSGEMLPPDVIIKYSSYFKDELTLDNMPRMQLINMCKYMNILPYGSDALLRFQLRHKIRSLQEDDQRILWEGIDSLTKMELREACQERGMRSTGLTKDSYRRALQQWLDLSVNQNVPISLLIMSRTFFLQKENLQPSSSVEDSSKNLTGLADAISGLDKDVVNEVILEVATSEEKSSSPEVIAIKLEVLETQNELIEEENKMRDAAAKKKKEAEMEKAEREKESTKITAIDNTKESNVQIESGFETKEVTDESIIDTSSVIDTSTVDSKVFSDEKETDVVMSQELDSKEIHEKSTVEKKSKDEITEKQEEQNALSSEEIDAISQLVSPDPVSRERETLERIKAAMIEEDEMQETSTEAEDLSSMQHEDLKAHDLQSEDVTVDSKLDVDSSEKQDKEEVIEEIDQDAKAIISSMEEKASREADASTSVSFNTETIESEVAESETPLPRKYEDEKLDKVVARLKSKVESMVGKIEIQLSDVESKIGDKLHILDKDMDGILSREEMAICLQSVLKRKLTMEEAMAIADDMDENEDGFFSVEELSNWLNSNKIVELVKAGRDAEVDKMISIQKEKLKEKQEAEEKDS